MSSVWDQRKNMNGFWVRQIGLSLGLPLLTTRPECWLSVISGNIQPTGLYKRERKKKKERLDGLNRFSGGVRLLRLKSMARCDLQKTLNWEGDGSPSLHHGEHHRERALSGKSQHQRKSLSTDTMIDLATAGVFLCEPLSGKNHILILDGYLELINTLGLHNLRSILIGTESYSQFFKTSPILPLFFSFLKWVLKE